MADAGPPTGPRGGFQGRGRGRGRGGPGGGRSAHHQSGQGPQQQDREREKPKKENILNLQTYMNQELRVKFTGGREITGILKGHDQLQNLVLDNAKETLRDAETGEVSERELGLTVVRAPLVTMINPTMGFMESDNPFDE